MTMKNLTGEAESSYAWVRLIAGLLLTTIGGSGMYAMAVALPPVQMEFGVSRADASLPYTLTMIGFGVGGIMMGRLADRFGVVVPIWIAAVCLGLGFTAAGSAQSMWQFSLAHGFLIGFLGCSATFAPLVADVSLWFTKRRGIAVAICSSGNYLAGAIWPPILQYFFETSGWRATYIGVGMFCTVSMLALSVFMRRRPPVLSAAAQAAAERPSMPLGMHPNALLAILAVAGVACCVAMSMPQVHIVAYAGDLGHGVALGAQMLSLMLGFGVVSRLASGWICDRIGGRWTLLLGSGLQALALALFLPFDGLAALYVLSALFGLFQGGIVPAYAVIVREFFPPEEAGVRVGTVIMATVFGMALGGWMSGVIFDLTGSYQTAFLNGLLWNLLNLAIAAALLRRPGRSAEAAWP